MAYNFKNLADVELLDTMPENAKVIVEVDGATKRAPKEDGIDKLVSVEALEEVPEGANVLVEVNGEIKRVPGSGLGGTTKNIVFVYEGGWDAPPTCNLSYEECKEAAESGCGVSFTMPIGENSIVQTSRISIYYCTEDGMLIFIFFFIGDDYDTSGKFENRAVTYSKTNGVQMPG